MEYVILGLLFLQPRTGYEIGCFIKNNLSIICSSSAGSVQFALKKLVSEKKLEYQETVENGKNKKTFMITEVGKEEFKEWVQNPMQISKVKNMELSKLFFLGFADVEKRRESIVIYMEQLKQAREVMMHINESIRVQSEDLLDASVKEILKYQQYTLQYGMDAAEFEMNWYSKLLDKMEEES